MTIQQGPLDGTVSYSRDPSRIWGYVLVVRFSESLSTKSTRPKKLERLQTSYRGSLHTRFSRDELMELVMPIIAHGPESACKQARDLRRRIKNYLDLDMNIASVEGSTQHLQREVSLSA